ncbi:hypothetical protein, conserved, partial [Plasmodium vivax]
MADSNQDYDSFQQYSNNHDVYERIKGNIGDEFGSFPDDVLGEQKEKYNIITMYYLRLRKYLRNFHDEKGCKNKNCCPYINYVLNKIVRTNYNSNQAIFDIYNTYMNHDNNNKEILNSCLTEIKYMDQDKYNKIHSLYGAYDICQSYISNYDNITSCRLANSCAKAYKNIMTEYIKLNDTKFCKTLKELKVFLEKYEPSLTRNCSSSFSVLLNYPHDCTDLQQKPEKINASKELSKVGLEVQGAPGERSVELEQGISEVKSPGVPEQGGRESAVGIVTEEIGTISDTQPGANEISSESPSAKTNSPAGTIIGTSLGFVLPLIT